jgi:hypothetical protein
MELQEARHCIYGFFTTGASAPIRARRAARKSWAPKRYRQRPFSSQEMAVIAALAKSRG